MIDKYSKKCMDIFLRHKLLILYVFFGGITTAVNFIVFFICDAFLAGILGTEVMPNWALTTSATVAWIIAVATAFITNKLYVFESKSFSRNTMTKELIPFVAARILSYLFDVGITILGVNYLLFNKLFVRIFSNVFVLVFNFIASKLFIFKNSRGGKLMNETIKSLLNRRSIRKFKPDPIDREIVDLIIKTGRYAASGLNSQEWHFSVVTNQKVIKSVVDAYKKGISVFDDDPEIVARVNDENYSNFYHAPVVIFVSGRFDSAFKVCDCANAIQNMCVAAYSLGIGSCYIASFLPAFFGEEKDTLNKSLDVPEDYEIICSVALGYADQPHPEPTPRRENTVSYIE